MKREEILGSRHACREAAATAQGLYQSTRAGPDQGPEHTIESKGSSLQMHLAASATRRVTIRAGLLCRRVSWVDFGSRFC